MTRASSFLSQAQRETVERAIEAAEQRTSAELVVVVASRSGRYDRAEDLFGLLLALLAVSAAWLAWQDLRPATQDWEMGHTLVLPLVPVLVMFALWSIVGAALATRFPALAQPFIPKSEREMEVRRRGLEAFHTFRVGHTTGRTGVLIFVSLLERMAWVVGDNAIAEKLPQSTWDGACVAVVSGIAKGAQERALVEAVSMCAEALAPQFPPRGPGPGGGPANQVPNTVRLID